MFDEKTHYKMYKSGKNWVFGAITTATCLLGLNMGAVTHADNVQSSSQNTQPKNESSVQSKQASQPSQQVVLKSSQSSQSSSAAAKTTVQEQPEVTNFAAVPSRSSQANSIQKQSSVQTNKPAEITAQKSQPEVTNFAAQPTKVTNQTQTAPKSNPVSSSKTNNQQGVENQQPVQAQSSSQAQQSSSLDKYTFAENHPEAKQVRQNNNWYLQENGKNLTGFQKIADQNKICYYNPSNGAMVYGQQRIDNKWYLFDKVTGALQFGYQWIGDQNKEAE